jgi:hypothetical protein
MDYGREHSEEIQDRIDRVERYRGEAELDYLQRESPEDKACRLYHEAVDEKLEREGHHE